jgi:hypothetical protein
MAMATACQQCQVRIRNTYLFCPACGALLHRQVGSVRIRAIDPLVIRRARTPGPATAAGHGQTLAGAGSALRRQTLRAGLIAGTALCFSVVFLIGLRQLIAHGGLPAIGMWAIAPVVLGGLLAEEAWVNGHTVAGLAGIVVWATLPWLLAADQALPWGLVVAGLWALAHAQNVIRWRRSATLSSSPTAAMVVSEKLPP